MKKNRIIIKHQEKITLGVTVILNTKATMIEIKHYIDSPDWIKNKKQQ